MPIQAAFTLNPNEIFATLANVIISQLVFADNLGKHQTLVDKARVDGSMYGEKKIFYATDVLESHAWGGDSEATNLLALDRPADPKVQAITLDKFRQIRLTVDYYLSKRAWMDEGSFSQFTSVMLGWMRETKKVYDGTQYNAFIGAVSTSVGKQTRTIDLTTALTGLSGVEKDVKEAKEIAKDLANLMVEMGDYSRDFNDYQFMRSYADESIEIIWNSAFVNKIRKVDLPTIFHKEGLVDKFEEDVLPEKYFGVRITSSNISTYSDSTPTTGKPIDSDNGVYTPGVNHANGLIRSMVEKKVTVGGTPYHVFAGDEIPSGATIVASGNFEPGEVYIETKDIICKVVVKLPPYMSAFEAGTSFFNPRSLTENHYLTFGHNTLEYFKNYPFITVKAA